MSRRCMRSPFPAAPAGWSCPAGCCDPWTVPNAVPCWPTSDPTCAIATIGFSARCGWRPPSTRCYIRSSAPQSSPLNAGRTKPPPRPSKTGGWSPSRSARPRLPPGHLPPRSCSSPLITSPAACRPCWPVPRPGAGSSSLPSVLSCSPLPACPCSKPPTTPNGSSKAQGTLIRHCTGSEPGTSEPGAASTARRRSACGSAARRCRGGPASRAGRAAGVAGSDLAVAVRAGQHRLGDVTAGVMDEHDRRPGRGGSPSVAPVQHRGDDGEQRQALLGQLVLVPWRVLAVGVPLQNALVGELPQPGGENAAGHAQAGLEIIEPGSPAERIAQDQRRPPLAHDVEGPGDRAVPVGKAGELHGSSLAE